MNNIIITFEDGTKKEYRKGIKLGEIIRDKELTEEIICGNFQNQIINYDDSINRSGTLILYDINSSYGNRIYEKGLTILFKTSAMEVLGKNTEIRIRHSIDKGVFFEIKKDITDKDIVEIKKVMKDKVDKAIPFIKVETTMAEAIAYFKNIKREDKVRTLFYNKNSYVTLYKFDGIYNYILGNLPNDSSILKYYDIINIIDGGICNEQYYNYI